MKTKALTVSALLATAAVAVAVVQSGSVTVTPQQALQSPIRLVFAQPYFLDAPYQHAWRADHPTVSAGYIIAITGEADVMPVKQTHDELMFVGDMPVERLNEGSESGVYIGFVPSETIGDGELALDLTTTPIYWAKPEILPESLTAADAQATLATAVAAGVVPQRAAIVERALAEGGGSVFLPSHGGLHRYGADVVERFSPQEADLIGGLRAPLVK